MLHFLMLEPCVVLVKKLQYLLCIFKKSYLISSKLLSYRVMREFQPIVSKHFFLVIVSFYHVLVIIHFADNLYLQFCASEKVSNLFGLYVFQPKLY